MWFEKHGIRFDVAVEDGKSVEKQFIITSKRLIRALRPIMMKAEEEQRNAIAVSILRIGEEFQTRYEVSVLPVSSKHPFRKRQ